ncbi:MAG: hypothetical protein Q4B54_10350, partial [Coriobacteriales bacterium]|nr:hypothetical protein [Coriobacteriales bacterium]
AVLSAACAASFAAASLDCLSWSTFFCSTSLLFAESKLSSAVFALAFDTFAAQIEHEIKLRLNVDWIVVVYILSLLA